MIRSITISFAFAASDSIKHLAASYGKTGPFDTAFDLATENSFYCSEYVWHAFQSAGLDVSGGNRTDISDFELKLAQKFLSQFEGKRIYYT